MSPPHYKWRLPYLAVLLVVMFAHFPELSGWASCNPIYRQPGVLESPPRQSLPGSCVIDGNDATTLQALGGREAEMWLHGELPWWNSFAGLGLPLAAEGQPGAFLLPFILLLHFFSGVLLLKIALQMVSGVFAVALFRELGLGRAAAGVGATVFALNGSFAWFADAPTLPIAFLPALVFAVERCRTRAACGQAGGPAWIAIALAYSLVAGFPETAFMDGLLALIWAFVAFMRAPRPTRGAFAAKILCGGAAGLALSAPAWLSFLDYLRISSIGIHSLVLSDRMVPSQAGALILPGIYGPPYADLTVVAWAPDGGYFGPATTLLACVALASSRRMAALRWAMVAWIAFWISVFFGAPVTHALWAALPPLNQVQVTRYAMPSLECAAAVLAALAVDDWRRTRLGVRVLVGSLAFSVLAAVTLVIASRAGRLPLGAVQTRLFLIVSLSEAIVVAAALTWLLAKVPTRRRLMAVTALVTLDATMHFVLPQLAGNRPNRLDLKPVAFLQGHAGLSRTYALRYKIPVNYGSWFGIPSIQALSIPFARVWDTASAAIGGDINAAANGWIQLKPEIQLADFLQASSMLQGAGVRYVVVDADHDPFVAHPQPDTISVFADERTRIYEMIHAAPYFQALGGPCELVPIAHERVRADCAAPAVLLRRELMLPGWHARLNGAKAAITTGGPPSQPFYQLVALPAGRNDIVWRYSQPHAMLMAALFASGVAAITIMAAHAARLGGAVRPARALNGE